MKISKDKKIEFEEIELKNFVGYNEFTFNADDLAYFITELQKLQNYNSVVFKFISRNEGSIAGEDRRDFQKFVVIAHDEEDVKPLRIVDLSLREAEV